MCGCPKSRPIWAPTIAYGCPKLRGRPASCVVAQNFMGDQFAKRGGPEKLWVPNLPETWDSTCCLGAQNFVDAGGCAWTSLGANDHVGCVDTCVRPCHTNVVAHITCLVAQFCGGCWSPMYVHVGPQLTYIRGRSGRGRVDAAKWAHPHSRVHAQSRGRAHFDAPMPTKLFTRQLRFTRQVFQNFFIANT